MTNGDKVRALDNIGLANLFYDIVITNKDSFMFNTNDRTEAINFLTEVLNEVVDYE